MWVCVHSIGDMILRYEEVSHYYQPLAKATQIISTSQLHMYTTNLTWLKVSGGLVYISLLPL